MHLRRLEQRRRRWRIIAPGALLAALLFLLSAPAALAQTFEFNIPKGVAATQLAAWSKVTGIRVELAPAVPASAFNLMTTNAIKGRMAPYQSLNRLLERTPIIILKERLDVVTLGLAASSGSATLLDSQPLPGASDPAAIAREQQLQQSLAPAFAPQVIAGLLATPDFGEPHAVGLKLGDGRYFVLVVQPPASGRADAGPRVCEAEVASDLGRRLAEGWRRVVARNVRRRATGIDGVTYTFAYRQAGGQRRREVWQPSPATAEGQIVAISKTMRAYCADASTANSAALTSGVAKLELMLREGR